MFCPQGVPQANSCLECWLQKMPHGAMLPRTIGREKQQDYGAKCCVVVAELTHTCMQCSLCGTVRWVLICRHSGIFVQTRGDFLPADLQQSHTEGQTHIHTNSSAFSKQPAKCCYVCGCGASLTALSHAPQPTQLHNRHEASPVHPAAQAGNCLC